VHVRQRTGALIIALRKRDGMFDTTPDPEVVLQAGDVMITVGTQAELRALEALFAGRQVVAG
jgi:voltage-gated potassium channel